METPNYVYCFPLFIFYSPFKHKIIYNDVKLFHQIEIFTPKYLKTNNKFNKAFLTSKVNKSFYCLLSKQIFLLLTNYIFRWHKFRPRTCLQASNIKYDRWNIFQTNVLHLKHLNINSLRPDIDELRVVYILRDWG